MEPLQAAPDTTSFTPLSVHQSRTPSSFHSGPAILHYHNTNCKLVILDRDLIESPPLHALRSQEPNVNGSSHPITEDEAKEVVIDALSVWVTSEKFLLYRPASTAGVSIPYPSISLHAIQRLHVPGAEEEQVQGLYMQVATPPAAASFPRENDEEECITMTLVLPSSPPESQEEEEETPVQQLYGAVSACSNLHPDPVEDEEEEGGGGLLQSGLISMGDGQGGLPPPMDGSSGWITADNMHEFFDEDGNWIGGGEEPSLLLGPGAGTVRGRDDEEGVDGEGEEEGDEAKWRRTD